MDREAAAELRPVAQPWGAPGADWNDAELRRRALFAASFKSQSALDDLTVADLETIGAQELTQIVPLATAVARARADLNARLNDELMPANQTVLCLSPHPDDDVICCGATLLKMATRGNKLWIAYGVDGANAVRDKDVLALLRARQARLISYLEAHVEPGVSLEDAMLEVRASIFEREAGAPDAPLLRQLKRLVREGEASDACRKMSAHPIFLDLPFYGDGAGRAPIGETDIARCLQLLERVQPDLVMLTGEKNDPHGTHMMCEAAFERAAEKYRSAGGKPFAIWNYRGAWDEYQVHEGDYFSLFDKPMMERKIDLILDHISQLDPLFPGDQTLEFWERARDRNRENARQLQRLGVLKMSRSFDPTYAEVFQIVPSALPED